MKTNPLISIISIIALTTAFPSIAQESATPSQSVNASSEANFRCDISQDIPSTLVTGMVNSALPDPSVLINWSAEYFSSPEEAQFVCEKVSEKLQSLYEEGELTTLTFVSQRLEDKVAVCFEGESATSECGQDQFLFTLNTDQSADEALYKVVGTNFKPPRTRGDFPTKMTLFPFSWLF